jgi:hypothetical protein
MRRLAALLICCLGFSLVWTNITMAQGRGSTDWMTGNGDAQRTAWVRTDAKISPASMQKPGFKFLWKIKLNNQQRQLNSLMPPSTLERLIGYRGFRMLGFVSGSSDSIFTIDTDLGIMEWEKRLTSTGGTQAGTLACPGGLTTGVVRPTLSALPSLAGGGGGPGRSNPAKGAAGEPGKGAVTLAMVQPNPPVPPPAQPSANPARPNPANPQGGQFGRGPFLVYVLSSSGKLHAMHLSNGADFEPPMNFLPPNANASGLIVVDNFAYVVTEGNCGGVPNGVWALDLTSKVVSTWKGNVAGHAGPAFGGDGTVYVATTSGGDSPNSVVALEAGTLKVKGSYSAGSQEFSSTPVIFEYKGKTLIAAATRDGRIHLLDSASLGGADQRTALFTTRASLKAADFAPGALASWQDRSGTRWILAPTVGTQAAEMGFQSNSGAVTTGAAVAWKLVEQNGAPMLQPDWISRNLSAPLVPTIINGVVFVTSSGEFRTNDTSLAAAQRALRSSPAVVYGLDGLTGKELWSSGSAITSFARGGALSGGMGQIYLTTYDGTIYAFGFPMEH